MKKSLFLILLIMFSAFIVSCKDDSGLKYKKIEASHNILSEDISSYLTVSSKMLNDELYYSLIIYSDFLQGNSRYYNYYQVDYKTINNEINQYYHNFTFEDANQRSYAQRFLPFQKVNEINEFDVLISYEYKKNDEKIVNDLLYHEDILKLSDKDVNNALNESDFYDFSYDFISDEINKLKINLCFNELNSGHLDFQTWIKTENGKLVPFFGVYHYQVERGNYKTISYEEINEQISEIYIKINYYSLANEKKEVVLKKEFN